METTFSQRLREVIHYTRKKDLDFARSIGISKQNLYTYLTIPKGKTKLGSPHVETLSRICEAYPQINIHWLITGNGEMLSASNNEINDDAAPYNKDCKECRALRRTIKVYENHIELLTSNLNRCNKELEQLTQDHKEKRKAG